MVLFRNALDIDGIFQLFPMFKVFWIFVIKKYQLLEILGFLSISSAKSFSVIKNKIKNFKLSIVEIKTISHEFIMPKFIGLISENRFFLYSLVRFNLPLSFDNWKILQVILVFWKFYSLKNNAEIHDFELALKKLN